MNFRYEAADFVTLLENADAEILVYPRCAERVAGGSTWFHLRLRVIDDGSDVSSVHGALPYDEVLATSAPAAHDTGRVTI